MKCCACDEKAEWVIEYESQREDLEWFDDETYSCTKCVGLLLKGYNKVYSINDELD